MNLKNKNVVVTGATAGIGYQTALEFCQEGARVIGVGRNPQRCAAARESIRQQVPGAIVDFLVADLASQQQVRDLAGNIANSFEDHGNPAVDVLVNNAGVYLGRKTLTAEGIETTFAVNHLAPFLLTNLLLPLLSRPEDARVITVSSDSHYHTRFSPERAKRPFLYFGLSAYKVSKLCNVLFSLEWNKRNQWHSPHAFAVDPGLVNTEIGMKDTGGLAKLVWKSRKNLGAPAALPARTILYLASDPHVSESRQVYWRDCLPKAPAQNALDENLAHRLWVESCQLTGIDQEG